MLTLQSSTCFQQYYAYLQEDKLHYYNIWYRHFLQTALQYAYWVRTLSALNRRTVRPFEESDDTRCYNNVICPPEDEHSIVRNMSGL